MRNITISANGEFSLVKVTTNLFLQKKGSNGQLNVKAMQHNLVERKLNIKCFVKLNYKQIVHKISKKNSHKCTVNGWH